ncbi:putative kynurenine 3-monooxygenase [Mycena olivaceomarginata]|nr:putative kynurenine 3-monooxygenase [Mycena olivaceomarginata]
MPIDRVLIVGGGLAGPALALALARQNIRSSVFEIRPQRTIADGSIALAPNALRALDHVIGVYDRLKLAGFSYRRLAMHAEDGQLFGHVSQSDSEYDALRILRSTLHNTMLDACEEQPDFVEVRFGVTITQIEDGEDGVTLRFEDGSSARGDILIGADGIHSKIREHVLGASAPKPTFLGSCMVSGTLPLSSIKAPSDWEFPAVLITSVGMVAVWPHNVEGTEAAWYVSEDLPDKDRAAWREYGASGEAARAAKRNYAMVQQETIRSLMDNVQDDAVTLWTPHSIIAGHSDLASGPRVSDRRRGARAAAERAGQRNGAVKHGFERVFTKFEKNRRTRIDRVRVLGHGAGAAKGGTPAAWKYMLKKWAMSAYFAWNGYELKDERISSYDVTQQDIGVE